jgi:excisionase family DNA binding protein
MKDVPPTYQSKAEAARYLGFSIRTLETLIAKGEIPVFKPVISGTQTRKVLFRREDLDTWLAQFRVDVSPSPGATGRGPAKRQHDSSVTA